MRANLRIGLTLVLFAVAAVGAELRNPVLFADYSDPDAIRVGDDYYLVSSSFQCVPGLPILHSRDLVHWTLIGHAVDRLPAEFDRPQHGNGLWAPSIRHRDGWFWIYVGDPDRGIFLTKARNPRGPWEPLTLVKDARGWIDPCPFWDDDGRMYLVHAWAKSRAGFNSVLSLNRLSDDGRRVLDEGTVVFDGREHHPTIEGPKLYKRNGWYYIFAPAGGVKTGWQTVLRSKNLYGPYEAKIVLEHGFHQGAWVDDWFLHFQDRGAYGRIVHLQPLRWINDWPEIGSAGFHPAGPPASSRRYDLTALEWQWHGNPPPGGKLTPVPPNLWHTTALLLQKFPAESFTATTVITRAKERAGLVVMGADYAALSIEGDVLRHTIRRDADRDGAEVETARLRVLPSNARDPEAQRARPERLGIPRDARDDTRGRLHLRVTISPAAVARFSFSTDGTTFTPIGQTFVARPGRWIGAKVGLFGPAGFDSFSIDPYEPRERASLVVARDGSGDFRTIQEAVDAIPSDNDIDRVILIRSGTYREKVHIAKNHVALVGEDREQTRIVFAQLRSDWRAKNPDDWGAAVINIDAADVVLANLTVHNDYEGSDDHQFAVRSMAEANRIALLNVTAIANGGDTVSLWNAESGLSYYADSSFEGHVDFFCPRGWAYATNCRFFGRNRTAAIWHDGSRDPDQKLVIRHSRFDGVADFPLGRNHRDAQFYLLDVTFSPRMADRPIYPADAPDPREWGERYYYASARRDGGDFPWHADNLSTAKGSPRDEDVTAPWTFGGRWDPAMLPAVLPFAAIPSPEHGWRFADPAGVTLRWTPGRNARASRVHFDGRTIETETNTFATGPLAPGRTYEWRVDSLTPDGVVSGRTWTFRADPRNVRIALVGDSTVTEKSGWGAGFKAQVAESAAVLNLARGGRSSKSFRAEGHWEDVVRRKPSHVLLQFGHNDQPGKGADRETDLPVFRANMARYVDEARAIGAEPVLITPLARRTERDELAPWADATRAVAAEKNVPLIDLHARSIAIVNELGPGVRLGPDKTHLDADGSALFGSVVASELRAVMPALAPHVRARKAAPPAAPWSVRMTESELKRTPDPLMLDATDKPRWEYTPGLVLKSIMHVAERTGDERYWKYVTAYYDGMIADDGSIAGGYRLEDYNIDRINAGKPLFTLYARTKNEKYRKAIELLRRQMREHPRVKAGGFWHKKRYPWQMWLDGLYMGAPFLAQYAKTFHEPALLDDVIHQFVLMERVSRDEKTGLLYHGWDESKQQKWADPATGRSPAFWGRAMGWYAMGLVETLDFVPLEHPRRRELIAILQRLAAAVTKVQDPKSGVWWQVVDQPHRDGNYLEASVTAMFTFSLLKAARLGYIDPKYRAAGRRAWAGMLQEFVTVDGQGLVNLNRVCQVAGLGGDPERGERYRSGTYEYYVTEKIRSNDPKGVGPFIFASLEMER